VTKTYSDTCYDGDHLRGIDKEYLRSFSVYVQGGESASQPLNMNGSESVVIDVLSFSILHSGDLLLRSHP